MLKRVIWYCVLICAVAVAGAAASDRSIRGAVEGIGDGYVRMAFESRDGVRGDGWNSISVDGSSFHFGRHDDDWERDCEEGPVHVLMKVRDGDVVRIKTRVGGRWRSDRDDADILDLGDVPPQDAADYLIYLAENTRESVAEDAILPAVLAKDVVVWPRLMEIARKRSRPEDVRKSAVFWLGQLAGDKATEGLVELAMDDAEDIEVRETAIFSLSQRDGRDNTRRLVEIARTNRHPQLRKSALFWLAQRDDPEVLDVFEEILLGD